MEICMAVQIDVVTETYQCQKAHKEVLVTYFVLQQPEINNDSIERLAFDCTGKYGCGILIEEGRQKSYEWAQCTHSGLCCHPDSDNRLSMTNNAGVTKENR
jgi:hypothetical protein